MSGFPFSPEIDIVFLALTALSISTGLLVYLIQALFGTGGGQDQKSVIVSLGAGFAMFLGLGWIVS